MAANARKTSFVWISYEVDVFLLMVDSESAIVAAVCILVSGPCTVDSILHGGTIEVRHG